MHIDPHSPTCAFCCLMHIRPALVAMCMASTSTKQEHPAHILPSTAQLLEKTRTAATDKVLHAVESAATTPVVEPRMQEALPHPYAAQWMLSAAGQRLSHCTPRQPSEEHVCVVCLDGERSHLFVACMHKC